MEISMELIKDLRQRTGAGVVDCKVALHEAKGDTDKAIEHLRRKGLATAAKKAGRIATDGLVSSYIHAGGKIGVLVEVNCESDFVARTADFQTLAKDLAMQIAASDPRFVRKEDVTEDILAGEREIYKERARAEGKPENVLDKIVQGRLSKYYSEACLLEQPFVKDTTGMPVKEHIASVVQKVGENIQVSRFVRFKLGERQ